MIDTPETLEEIAAGWLARQRSGAMSPAEAAELAAWLAADPDHREAYEHLESLWRASAHLRTDPQIMALRDEAARAWPPRARRRWFPAAAAAAVAVAVLGGWQAISPQTAPTTELVRPGNEQVFSTGVGQTATVTLSDGSVVTLDTDSRVRARRVGDQRRVWLDRGQAFFKVAHDAAHPFVVAAGGRTITALGTQFNVRLDRDRVEVVLAEGRVRVEGAKPFLTPVAQKPPAADLTPGSRLVAAPDQRWQIAKVNVDTATSWRRGQLVFVRRPLGEVVDEINRYSEKKIVVADASLAEAPITGGFPEGDVEAFVRAVEGYGLATVSSDSDSKVVLSAR
ncbi:MAG: FecR family protein [Ignavibacteriales bacterium]